MGRKRRRPSDALVVDSSRQFVEYVPAAMARRLLKAKIATFHRRSPFAIMLAPGITEIPALWAKEKKMTTEEKPRVVAEISKTEPPKRRTVGYSHREFFARKEAEDEDIYVQNVCDRLISLSITVDGEAKGFPIPPTPDPVCISDNFLWESLKKSVDFRAACSKRVNGRPQMILLDQNQGEAYYAAKARQMHALHTDGAPDIDTARAEADRLRRKLTISEDEQGITKDGAFTPPRSALELVQANLAERGFVEANGQLQSMRQQAGTAQFAADMDTGVNRKVMYLCAQVSPHAEVQSQMTAKEFMSQLQTLQSVLTLEDYQYVEAHGVWGPVKNWARSKVAELAAQDAGLPAPELEAMLSGPIPQSKPVDVPASLSSQGVSYQGPSGFANAPFKEASAHPVAVLGPDGRPL